MLLAAHARPEVPTQDGASAIHIAAECSHSEIVELLVGDSNSQGVDMKDKFGRTALLLAVTGGEPKLPIVKMLL